MASCHTAGRYGGDWLLSEKRKQPLQETAWRQRLCYKRPARPTAASPEVSIPAQEVLIYLLN